MGALDGRVVVVTGAGRGIGREHALLMAREGAHVLVNDVGATLSGEAAGDSPAESVVQEILDFGGIARAHAGSVSDWDGAAALIEQAVATFGRLDVLVNNAGIVRDSTIVSMDEAQWDAVINVNLKGHFAPTHFAAQYWRHEAKAGRHVDASIIHTSSGAGLRGNPGQANYAAAKAGVAALSLVSSQELARYGVRSNCIAPTARTRMTESTPWLDKLMARDDSAAFDPWDPANMSPIVGYLATAGCPFNGCTFSIRGGSVRVMQPWSPGRGVKRDDRAWTVDELGAALAPLATTPAERQET